MPSVSEWTTSTPVTADKLNESGHVRSVTYNSGASRLEVIVGPVQANFTWPGRTSTIVTKTATTQVNISSPAINTTYYVWLKSDGTFRTSTTNLSLFDEVLVGSVSTGATLSTLTRADLRGMIPVPLSGLVPIGDPQVLASSGTAFPSVTIPQGVFQSIAIVGCIQGASGAVDYGLQLNGDTGNNYGLTQLFETGGGPQGNSGSVFNYIPTGLSPSGSSSVFVSFLSGLLQTALTNRPVISMSSGPVAGTWRAGYWNQAVAITSLRVVGTASMLAGSMMEVLGIR